MKLHLDGYAGEHETEGAAIMDDDGHLLITTAGWYAFRQDWKAYTGFAESVVSRYNAHARLVAALRVIAIALKEPSGGGYWQAIEFAEGELGLYVENLDGEHVLGEIARAVLADIDSLI